MISENWNCPYRRSGVIVPSCLALQVSLFFLENPPVWLDSPLNPGTLKPYLDLWKKDKISISNHTLIQLEKLVCYYDSGVYTLVVYNLLISLPVLRNGNIEQKLTWAKMPSLVAESPKFKDESDFSSILTICLHVTAVVKQSEIIHSLKHKFTLFIFLNQSLSLYMLLTIVAVEGKWAAAPSVPQRLVRGVMQNTLSIIIWLITCPISEGTVALVRPFPLISEQTDPECGRRRPPFIKHLLQGLIFGLAAHTGQVVVILSAVPLGVPPRLLFKNNVHLTGPLTCKYCKMYWKD